MTAIEEMAGMDVLCSDKTGTLTLNKLSVDKNMIEVTFSTLNNFRYSTVQVRKKFNYNNRHKTTTGACYP